MPSMTDTKPQPNGDTRSEDNAAATPQHLKLTTVNYGGQAVIEGVMMRGSRALSVAVRNPAGDVVVHTEPLDPRIYGGGLSKVPFVRGVTLLWDAMGLGVKSLLFSADVAIQEENPPADKKPEKVFDGPAEWTLIAFSLAMSVFIFFVIPVLVAGLLERWLGLQSSFLVNLVEGVVRLLLLIGYVSLISLMPDIKRLYGYHGAEHKTINAYEAKADLTVESVARFPLEHPRCGTAFLLTVVVISIILYSFLPPLPILLRVLTRLLLLPVVAGIAYEFLRFSAAHQNNALIRLITKPNLALQKLTTREPDAGMLEVAITAFKNVLAYEQSTMAVQDQTQTVAAQVPVASQAAAEGA